MRFTRGQLFIAGFFVLLTVNAVFCHWIGTDFLAYASEVRLVKEAGGEPSALGGQQQGRGALLLLINLPFFIGLGFEVKSAAPGAGFLYWSTLIAGATYLPLALTLLIFLFVHAPGSIHALAGEEVVDPDEPLEIDDD